MSVRQLPWMADLKVGDVIARPRGKWRVVRQVSRCKDGSLRSVTLSIQRCSWTKRCYTILNATDLRIIGYRKIDGARWSCRTKLDRLIHAAIHQPSDEPRILTCCDVEGIS